MLALSLLVAVLRIPSLEEPFDNDSGANAYHARLIVRGEPLYGSHHPAHHLPAVYYAYALAFYVFGDSVFSVKLLLILWTIVTTYLVYQLGLQLRNRMVGLLAAVFYALLSSHSGLKGTTAEIELFANLPRVAAILLVTYLLDRRAHTWSFALVGALAGIAFLFKAVYLSPLVVAGLALLGDFWQRRSSPGVWRRALERGVSILAGFAAVLVLVLVYFGLLDLLPRFLLVFRLGHDYLGFLGSKTNRWMVLLAGIAVLAWHNAALAVYGLYRLLRQIIGVFRADWRRPGDGKGDSFYFTAWCVLSYAEVNAAQVAWVHYYLLLVPPMALLAASFLVDMYQDMRKQATRVARVTASSVLILWVGVALLLSGTRNFDYYYHYARYRSGLETHREFVIKAVPWGSGLMQVQDLADYVASRTTPQDHIYYWSTEPQVYYLADRRCAIDMIWPLYAEASGSYERIFSPQTKYLILGESVNIPRPAWLYEQLDGKYHLEKVIDNRQIYRRLE